MTRSRVVTARTGGATVIALVGEVDLASADDLQAHVDLALGSGQRLLVFDLERATFLDSSVLHALSRAAQRARYVGGGIALVKVAPHLGRVFEVFGLTREVRIYATAQEAIAGLRGAGQG